MECFLIVRIVVGVEGLLTGSLFDEDEAELVESKNEIIYNGQGRMNEAVV